MQRWHELINQTHMLIKEECVLLKSTTPIWDNSVKHSWTDKILEAELCGHSHEGQLDLAAAYSWLPDIPYLCLSRQTPWSRHDSDRDGKCPAQISIEIQQWLKILTNPPLLGQSLQMTLSQWLQQCDSDGQEVELSQQENLSDLRFPCHCTCTFVSTPWCIFLTIFFSTAKTEKLEPG